MRRALLIAGGTVGGLGVVLAITPPQFAASDTLNIASVATESPAASAASMAASPSQSATARTKESTKVRTRPSATPKATGSGTFTGPDVFVNYGTVQVKITLVNGRVTDAIALKAPTGRSERWTKMALPILKSQTLAAQSADIQGASGASYTSLGWTKSLQGALADAGL